MQEIKQNVDEPKAVLEFGGKIDESSVTMRIFGDNLDPDELTHLLNCQPTEAYKKGHIVTTTVSEP